MATKAMAAPAAAPIPLIVLIGASPRSALAGRRLLSAVSSGERGRVVRQLSSNCLCCGGRIEMQMRLRELLREPADAPRIVELACGTHLAQSIDVLHAGPWHGRLRLHAVCVAASADCATDERMRALVTAGTHLLLVAPWPDGARLESWRRERPFGASLSVIGTSTRIDALNADIPIDDRDRAACVALLADQRATPETSWNLQAIDDERVSLDACWPAHRRFDRRRLMAAFDRFASRVHELQGEAAFATARDGYWWRATRSATDWTATDYRQSNRIAIECARIDAHSGSIDAHAEHFEFLREAIEKATTQ